MLLRPECWKTSNDALGNPIDRLSAVKLCYLLIVVMLPGIKKNEKKLIEDTSGKKNRRTQTKTSKRTEVFNRFRVKKLNDSTTQTTRKLSPFDMSEPDKDKYFLCRCHRLFSSRLTLESSPFIGSCLKWFRSFFVSHLSFFSVWNSDIFRKTISNERRKRKMWWMASIDKLQYFRLVLNHWIRYFQTKKKKSVANKPRNCVWRTKTIRRMNHTQNTHTHTHTSRRTDSDAHTQKHLANNFIAFMDVMKFLSEP